MVTWKHDNKAKGLCVVCDIPVEDKRFYQCEGCRQRNRERSALWQERQSQQGCCRTCGKALNCESSTSCRACLVKARKRSRRYHNCKPRARTGRGRATIA